MNQRSTKDGKIDKSKLDTSNEIIVTLAVELPFWIPIKSGDYNLVDNRTVKVRNDLWMVSTTNIIDGPLDQPFDYIFNENQVTDRNFLEKQTGGKARYFHKRKMRTTFTRAHSVTPISGRLSAKPLSDEWIEQLNQVVFGLLQQQVKFEEFLFDSNLFIDLYSALISPQNPSREVRRVSFYETMIYVRITCINERFRFEHITKLTPDLKMAELPFPAFRVAQSEELLDFRGRIQNCEQPTFHQLQWIRTLNYNREKRYQEALLHAAITLESLVHVFLSAKGLSRKQQEKEIGDAGGLADWLRSLKPEGLTNECGNTAKLWRLRNDVVHEEKILTEEDIESIKTGIQSLAPVRTYLLKTGKPEILKLENRFASFLEPVELGKAMSKMVGQMVQMKYGWRMEKDCYRTSIEPECPVSIPKSDNEEASK